MISRGIVKTLLAVVTKFNAMVEKSRVGQKSRGHIEKLVAVVKKLVTVFKKLVAVVEKLVAAFSKN